MFNADRPKLSTAWRVVQSVAAALDPDSQDMAAWLATGNPPAKTITDSDARGILTITLEVQDGAAYVTTIYSYGSGLDLRVLPDLAASLPRLQWFQCYMCGYNRNNTAAHRLPPSLPAVAPALRQLLLSYNNLTGPLPQVSSCFSQLGYCCVFIWRGCAAT
jgi:hypothetical protein